jgi:HAD superfamily hydrolase (TIGR01509 family)
MTLTTAHAVIFDLDGVIIDSEPLHERATRAAGAEHGIDVPDAVFDAFRGQTDEAIAAHLAERADDVAPSAILAAKHAAYEALIDDLTLMPRVLDLIQALTAQRRPLALVTSAARRDQERTFARFDLAPYFRVVVTAGDVSQAKPHPEPYQQAVQRLEIAPSACWVIEDSTHGVTAARRAGCHVVGFCSSFAAPALKEAGAHHTIHAYDELIHALHDEKA